MINLTDKELADSINYDLQKDELDIKYVLDSNIEKYNKDIESMLQNNPLQPEQQALYAQKLNYKHLEFSTDSLLDLLNEIRFYDYKFNTEFYTNEMQNIESKQDSNTKSQDLKELHKNILNEWEKSYQHRLQTLQQQKADSIKREMIQRLKEWLKALREIQELFNNMGEAGDIFKQMSLDSIKEAMARAESLKDSQINKLLNNLKSGRGADKSSGKLKNRMRNFEYFLNLLKQDSIKKLCEMLGKMQKAQKKNEIKSFSVSETYNIKIPTPYAKEEIAGVTLGRDLENVLPFEYALLKDSEFSILFDMKFAENRLFCFEKQGYIEQTQTREVSNEREKEIEDKKGPVILCIDTSGSMQGEPEIIAKAVSLYIAKMAMEQHRACFLINFSTSIETLDLSAPAGLFSLMNFLELSFNGGTDSIPALKAAIKKCEDFKYQKADILMISDFIFDSTNEREMHTLRANFDKNKRENKLHALYIGDFNARNLSKKSIFDNEFIYNPSDKSVILKSKDSVDSVDSTEKHDIFENLTERFKDLFF